MDVDRIVMDLLRLLAEPFWQLVLGALYLAIALLAVVHAMLYKRDSRAAMSWIAVTLLFPLLGPALYYLFGINRVRSQAHKLSGQRLPLLQVGHERGLMTADNTAIPVGLDRELRPFAQVSGRMTPQPLVAGNQVLTLHNGEEAYPAMLAAIAGAQRRVLLCSYIFESDHTGREFVAALAAAQERGVEVRVLVDGFGELYSWPRIGRLLRRAELPTARFLPPRLLPPSLSLNLRNHRKIMLVDDREGFTGGMNIGDRHMLTSSSRKRAADLHFRVRGPILAQLEKVFLGDWRVASGKQLAPLCGDIQPLADGEVFCRCISDGPGDDLDKISMTLLGAISCAREEILILTPYFLPSREMVASLQSATLRGVRVIILLPAQNNLPFVHWASRNMLWELLLYDVEIRYQPAPFSHAKLFVVDRCYAQVGSANLDPRSLRLNFELNLELFSGDSVLQLAREIHSRYPLSTPVTLKEIDQRSLPVRLRDAFFWLFQPYL
ncbi:phospholipase D-like domain-containing protein [Haliea sp. E1-2-M8]|uniref:phospholipase D-like domain-containing protein n=1 Tax=Haliea sp. E1-2-M8 TaxID=3064706 RepID=UPI00271A0A5B|nr:phospholipase D-like domain-containing protein [Haliea sp. E1-2-M8]MDO8862550.1 phospholipase D-like domain-containing protein [Haliea sp. E1-2-M8]